MTGSQNINLAIPIDAFKMLSRARHRPLASIITPVTFYEGFTPAPDFGASFNINVFSNDSPRYGTTFSYLLDDIPGDIKDITDEYIHLLEQNFFVDEGFRISRGISFRYYYNSSQNIAVSFGIEEINDRECFTVCVH